MIILTTEGQIKRIDKNHLHLILLFITLVIMFRIVGTCGKEYYTIIETHSFLYYHVVLEFISIITYFAIFIITYYTYFKNKRARLIVLFCTFFIVGFIDFFHTMTYKGMPGFFVESGPAIATTYWIIGRGIFAIGLLSTAIIPRKKRIGHNRGYYMIGASIMVLTIFYLVTYRIDVFPPLFIENQGLTQLKINLEYIIMVLMIITIFLFLKDYNNTKNVVFAQIIGGLLFAIFSEACFTLYKDVHDSYNMIGHMYKVISSYLIFRAIFVKNLDSPYMQLSEASNKIQEYADNLEGLVYERTKELQEANKKILKDLKYARRIQQSLLPSKRLMIHNVNFTSEFIPCQNVSGDFYDIYQIDENHLGIYIADVAGHGSSAAMMTIFTERALAHKHVGSSKKRMLSCEKNLLHLYEEFNKSNLPAEMHIAVLNAIYNKITGVFSYCSAGMNTIPLLFRATGEMEILDKSQGFPICKLGDIYKPVYKKAIVQLDKGDRIFFYTDGLVGNFEGYTFMEKKSLENILYNNRHAVGGQLRKTINAEIRELAKSKLIDDDITFLIMDIGTETT
mgnify:CR=1 FL=1